jgi:tetratricopeptide (TPR) repeat protein
VSMRSKSLVPTPSATVALAAFVLIVTGAVSLAAIAQVPDTPRQSAPVRFSQFDAYPRLIERIEAEPVLNVYQNSVWADVTISREGGVESVKILRGNPVHFKSARNAFMKWHFKPFTVNGDPVRAVVELSILIPDHAPDPAQAATNIANQAATNCLTAVRARDGNAVEAETTCRAALEAQRKLVGEETSEVEYLESGLGVAILAQGRTREALGHLERALAIGQKVRMKDDADLGGECRLVGAAQAKLGEWETAEHYYARAVETIEAAIPAVPSLRPLYEKQLQVTLREYAAVKRASGEVDAAAALEKKAGNLDSADVPILDVTKSGPDVTIRNKGWDKLELSKITTNDRCEYRFYEATVQGNKIERERRGHWWSTDTKDRQLETPMEVTLTLEPGASTEVHLLTGGIQCGDPVSLEVQTRQGSSIHTFRPRK